MAQEKPLKLPEDGTGSFDFWKAEVDRSREFVKNLAAERKWDENVASQLGKPLDSAPRDHTVIVPKDHTLVEQKKALLFFQVPEVSLTAQQPGLEESVALFQAVVNHKLRPTEVNAAALMSEIMADVLCPAGIGISKIGYEAEQQGMVPVQQPIMDPAGQPIVDPMTGQPAMGMVEAPNIVNERYYWERIPPKRFLFPTDFNGSDWDKAPWLGFSFEMDRVIAERLYGLAEDEGKRSNSDEDEYRIKGDVKIEPSKSPKVQGVEVWYRGAYYLPDVANTECFYQLTWFDGQDAPAVHRKSPYQTEQNGRVIAGMRGNPIHPFTLRYVSDQAIPPSDVSVSRPQVDELSAGRTDMVLQRRTNKPVYAFDPARVPPAEVDKLRDLGLTNLLPIPGFAGTNDTGIGEVGKAVFPRENFTFNDYIDRDINAAWAIDSNQQGQSTGTKRTATELSIINSASQTRMERERGDLALDFVRGVEKLASLIQLFADNEDYVEIVGQNGVRALQAWDKTKIQGRFAFTAKPDSTLRLDASFDKKQAIDEYQMFRKDPLVQPTYLLQRTARRLSMDPAQFVAQPQPPKPEIPNGLSVGAQDLNPMMPHYANLYTILDAAGFKGLQPPMPQVQPLGPLPQPPQMQQGQQEHGGMAPQAEPLNKHQMDQTQQLPGGGQAPQANPAGMMR